MASDNIHTQFILRQHEYINVQQQSILLKLNCCVCVCLFVRIVLKRWTNKNRTNN